MTKITTDDLNQLGKPYNARLKNGEEYISTNHKYTWICEQGHEFTRSYVSVKNNHARCPVCNPKIPHNRGKTGVSSSTREKMRKAKLGKTPRNKGSTMSFEQRTKLSCSARSMSYSEFMGFADKQARALKYSNSKYKSDPSYRLAKQIRNKLYKTLNKGTKSKSLSNIVGCTIQELRTHLESQFDDYMHWNNQGNDGWHIDHIVPLASFDLMNPEQLKHAWHYTNLQPLWSRHNLIKNNKNTRKNKLIISVDQLQIAGNMIVDASCEADCVGVILKHIERTPIILWLNKDVEDFVRRYGQMFDIEVM